MHSHSIARIGLFPYLVCILYLSGTTKKTSLGITKRHSQAVAECLAGAKRICSPVRPYTLPFDLTHRLCTPTIVSGGACTYYLNYLHALGIDPLTSLSPPSVQTHAIT